MSKYFNTVKLYYESGFWSIYKVQDMVYRNVITSKEFTQITGKEFPQL